MSYPTPMDIAEAEDREADLAEIDAIKAQLGNRTAELIAVQKLLSRAERLLSVYRFQTPLGHQPHMIAGEVDEFFKVIDHVAHTSDCAVHNEPAFPADPCSCGATTEFDGMWHKLDCPEK